MVQGKNDLATLFPNIAKYYDTEKNGNTASCIQAKSNKKVFWTCDIGHSFSMTVLNRVRHEQSCPYCFGHQLLQGFNDLQTVFPDISLEWDYSKNTGGPSDYTYGSGYEAWWLCKKCGNSYKSPINVHIRDHGCPYCAGKLVAPGRNDLQTLFPSVAKEYAVDNDVPASRISAHTHKKVKWICPKCNSEYWASPHHRTSKDKTECPFCKRQSKGERLVESVLDQYKIEYKTQDWFEDLRGDGGRPLRFDFAIYNHGKPVGMIEYQGKQHYEAISIFGGEQQYLLQHEHDKKKLFYCLNRGIPVLQIAYARSDYYMSVEEEVIQFLKNLKIIEKDK